jgi:hypothetical protein
MSLRPRAFVFGLTLLLCGASATPALASYSTLITTPTPTFLTIPGGWLACGGWVDWTWPIDTACSHVKVTLGDGHGHANSIWANCNVGYSSTTWTATVSANGLQPSGQNGALLIAQAFDSNLNPIGGNAVAAENETISV